MATYYVDSTAADDTGNGLTPATAKKTVAAAITAGNTATGPHTLYIAPGTYTGAAAFTDSDWANAVVQGVASLTTLSPAARGAVVLNGDGNYALQAGVSITARNIRLSGGTILAAFITAASVLEDCDVIDLPSSEPFLITGGPTYLRRCRVMGNSKASAVPIKAGAEVHLEYCLIINSNKQLAGAAEVLRAYSTGALYADNCVIGGSMDGPVAKVTAATAAMHLRNCILIPSKDSTKGIVDNAAGGTFTRTNCVVSRFWNGSTADVIGSLTSDTATVYASPRFKRLARSGYIIPSIDDLYESQDKIDYVTAVETELAQRGMKGTWYVESAGLGSLTSSVQAIHDRGTWEVGVHGYSHSLLTTVNVMTVTKAGATVAADRATDTITIDPGGTVEGFKAKTIAAIKTELEALGCTVAVDATINTRSLGEIMNTASGASPLVIPALIDATAATGFYRTEISDAKTVMEAALTGYTAETFATPGGARNTSVDAATKATGFIGSRHSIGAAGYMLQSINVYLGVFVMAGDLVGADDAETRQKTRFFCDFVAQYGAMFDLLAHNATECSIANWRLILDTIKNEYPEITTTSRAAALADIRNAEGAWTTSDQATYTRAEWPEYADYRLRAESPCRDAGTNLNLTTDFAGRSVGAVPDVGAYEYRATGNRGGLGVRFRLGL